MEERDGRVLEIAPLLRGLTFDGEKGATVCFSDRLLTEDVAARLGGATVDLGGLDETEAEVRIGELFPPPGSEHSGPAAGRVRPAVVVCRPFGSFYLSESYDAAQQLMRDAASDAGTAAASGGERGMQAPSAPPGPGRARRPDPNRSGRNRGDSSRFDSARVDRGRVVENKISVVTGGAQGFGEEIVRHLAQAGSLVFIADLNGEGARVLADELNRQEDRTCALPVTVDVSDEDSVRQMVEQVVRRAGGIDLFISNAGVLKAGSVKDLSAADFEFVTKVNYTGFFLGAKWVSQVMARQNGPSRAYFTDIIQINSKSGLEGSNRNGAYAGSKFGGIGLAQSFALELVSDNIKVNAICPGNFLDGPLWSDPQKGLFVQYLRAGKVPGARSVADVKRYYEERVPMRRGCTGDDVVKAVFYAVEQKYETGQAIPVTGGQVMLR